MKISQCDSLSRSAAEPKYAKSRQTGIRRQVPQWIGTLSSVAIDIAMRLMRTPLTMRFKSPIGTVEIS